MSCGEQADALAFGTAWYLLRQQPQGASLTVPLEDSKSTLMNGEQKH